jgi:hypothetical protein
MLVEDELSLPFELLSLTAGDNKSNLNWSEFTNVEDFQSWWKRLQANFAKPEGNFNWNLISERHQWMKKWLLTAYDYKNRIEDLRSKLPEDLFSEKRS